MKKILPTLKSPGDIKILDKEVLPYLCEEIREYIIAHGAKYGGHFGSSLGTVELTVALHRIFNAPNDSIVWDVGHQAYAHKLLTGRKKKFSSLRKKNGLAGFPKPSESKYDAFISGHASVSISATLGMAVADTLQGKKNYHIAVIGDGALTGGEAFEGLNNAGDLQTDMIIIVNDNQMSIDPNIGGLKNSLLNITKSSPVNALKSQTKNFLQNKSGKMGKFFDSAISLLNQKIKNSVFSEHNFFESLGCQYYGPYNGHDVQGIIRKLENIKDNKGVKIVHLITTKGKGFSNAEKNQTLWHATSGFCLKEKKQKKSADLQWQDVFGHTLAELMKKNDKIIGITPAMLSGCGMKRTKKILESSYPLALQRIFDTGIAEQHAVTFSAGLASKKNIPFCNLYSTFCQRAYDQIIHDVCIESLPVIFCLDRAGFVGEDGETHQGLFDLAFLRPLPNTIIAAPYNAQELQTMMYTASTQKKNPFFIRYPKGNAKGVDMKKNSFSLLEIGKGRCLQEGKNIAIISLGAIGQDVTQALGKFSLLENKKFSHYDMRFLKPLDTNLLDIIFKKYKKIFTVEEGVKKGGLGSAILEYAQEKAYAGKIKILGVQDTFIAHGRIAEQKEMCGIDAEGIYTQLKK